MPLKLYLKKHILQLKIVNIVDKFNEYSPASAGSSKQQADITIHNINNFSIQVEELLKNLNHNIDIVDIEKTFKTNKSLVKEIKDSFIRNKASKNEYLYSIYSFIKKNTEINNVLEVGMGTNNQNIISHMDADYIPGGSLRAFRDFFPKATIYGADVDKDILFQENRIKTFFIDQTDFDLCESAIKSKNVTFDLVIDDGLHSTFANLSIINATINYLSVGGWIVIEDISPFSLRHWKIISVIFQSSKFKCYIAPSTTDSYLFLLNRLK